MTLTEVSIEKGGDINNFERQISFTDICYHLANRTEAREGATKQRTVFVLRQSLESYDQTSQNPRAEKHRIFLLVKTKRTS